MIGTDFLELSYRQMYILRLLCAKYIVDHHNQDLYCSDVMEVLCALDRLYNHNS